MLKEIHVLILHSVDLFIINLYSLTRKMVVTNKLEISNLLNSADSKACRYV